jgi:sodium-coupled neutral amino acid transporter 11
MSAHNHNTTTTTSVTMNNSNPSNKPPASPFFAPNTPRYHQTTTTTTPGGTTTTTHKTQTDHDVIEHKSSLAGCVANLMNAIVGSGIVGIPYAIRQAGLLAGILLVVLAAILTEKSLRLLVATAKYTKTSTYETAMESAFGIFGFRFVTANMFVMANGAMVSYLMIVKDSWSSVFHVGVSPTAKAAVLLVISLTIMVPLSSQRDVADLAKTSRLNVVIDTLLVALVAVNAPVRETLTRLAAEGNNETTMGDHHLNQHTSIASILVHDTIRPRTLFVGLGVLSFAYVCQHSAFIIAGSLDRPTQTRWDRVTKIALTLCGCLALAIGTTGYLAYQEETQGNILNNLNAESASANMARAMLGTTMLFVYPLESFVARHVCVVLLFSGRRAHEGEDSSILNRRDRRIGLTVILYLMAVIPAAMFEDMGSVLAVTGAIGGSCLSYVGPGLVYLGVHGARFLELLQESWLGSMLPMSLREPTEDTTRAVETTPLVARDGTKSLETIIKPEEEHRDDMLRTIAKTLTWYLCCFPLWVWIASTGKRNIKAHIRDMALKSPHPIRIGDVEYSVADYRRAANAEDGGDDDDETNDKLVSMLPFKRVDSMPSKMTVLPGGSAAINQRIGQQILKKQKMKRQTVQGGEPPHAAPTWRDFFIAIFFMLFGGLAFIAGILSLFIQTADAVALDGVR